MDGSPGVKQCPNCAAVNAGDAAACSCGFSFPLTQQAATHPTANDNVQAVDQNRFIIALLLVVFLGHLGIHRFYMGYKNEGIAILLLQVVGWATACVLVGFLFLAAAYVWWLIDLILIASNSLKMADGTSLR